MTIISSNQVYQFYKQGEYTQLKLDASLDMSIFDDAKQQLEKHFYPHRVIRDSFCYGEVKVSGFCVLNIKGKLQALIVLNTATSLKEKSLFKSALYAVIHRLNHGKPTKVFSLFLNKKYSINNNENLFILKNISQDAMTYFNVALDAVKAIQGVQANLEQAKSKKILSSPESILPKPFKKTLKTFFAENPLATFRDVPVELLNPAQKIVCEAHTINKVHCDSLAFYKELSGLCDLSKPSFMLDFEAAQFIKPIWYNVTPYSQVAFQYSLHRLHQGHLSQTEYIELENDPRLGLALQLIDDLKEDGAIFVFNASFERMVINNLANLFPPLSFKLQAISDRIVDLHPLIKKHYYCPTQAGSWSLKAVLPAILGYNPYDELNCVANGEDAALAYHQARNGLIDKATTVKGLSQYCTLDTYALYEMFVFIKKLYVSTRTIS